MEIEIVKSKWSIKQRKNRAYWVGYEACSKDNSKNNMKYAVVLSLPFWVIIIGLLTGFITVTIN